MKRKHTDQDASNNPTNPRNALLKDYSLKKLKTHNNNAADQFCKKDSEIALIFAQNTQK